MVDAIVVGCGIIGATVTAALRRQGRETIVIDDARPMRGTAPSGGHLKPSWFGGMAKTDYEPAIQLLDDVWGLISEDFVIRPIGTKTTVYRVDTSLVESYERTIGEVLSVANRDDTPVVTWKAVSGERYAQECRLLVIATGHWAGELCPEIKVSQRQGVSFRFSGQLEQPFIKPWAPYKQVVAHQQSDNEIWVGDGTTIMPKNWTDMRTRKCLGRCRMAIDAGTAQPLRVLTGIRPYCKTGKDPCLLQQVHKSVWVATGAGKSGTIAAGWSAGRIANATN